jgi:hypothetical protein
MSCTCSGYKFLFDPNSERKIREKVSVNETLLSKGAPVKYAWQDLVDLSKYKTCTRDVNAKCFDECLHVYSETKGLPLIKYLRQLAKDHHVHFRPTMISLPDKPKDVKMR